MDDQVPAVILMPQEVRTEYVTTDVHVHRAPTDESVRLLQEMEQKARDKIEKAVSIGGNGFECVVHCSINCESDERIAVALFALNGMRLRAEARVRGFESRHGVDLVLRLRDEVAKLIASEIVGPAFARSGLFAGK